MRVNDGRLRRGIAGANGKPLRALGRTCPCGGRRHKIWWSLRPGPAQKPGLWRSLWRVSGAPVREDWSYAQEIQIGPAFSIAPDRDLGDIGTARESVGVTRARRCLRLRFDGEGRVRAPENRGNLRGSAVLLYRRRLLWSHPAVGRRFEVALVRLRTCGERRASLPARECDPERDLDPPPDPKVGTARASPEVATATSQRAGLEFARVPVEAP